MAPSPNARCNSGSGRRSAHGAYHGPIANSHVGVGAGSADGVYVTTASEVSLLPKAGSRLLWPCCADGVSDEHVVDGHERGVATA